MMRLRIVNSAKNEEDQLPHGTKVLKELVMPWDNTDRIVYAYSYFTSVPDAKEFWKHGIGFIGIINIATLKFPMVYLFNI